MKSNKRVVALSIALVVALLTGQGCECQKRRQLHQEPVEEVVEDPTTQVKVAEAPESSPDAGDESCEVSKQCCLLERNSNW